MTLPPPRPELLALLNAAKAEPDDDTPRLVLADWLQEQSAPADVARGEWLRNLVEANRLIPEDPRRPELLRRAKELWQQNCRAGAAPLYQVGYEFPYDEATFRGGFLNPSAYGTDVLRKKGLAVVGSEVFAWITGLNFQRFMSIQMTKLLASPIIESITSRPAAVPDAADDGQGRGLSATPARPSARPDQQRDPRRGIDRNEFEAILRNLFDNQEHGEPGA